MCIKWPAQLEAIIRKLFLTKAEIQSIERIVYPSFSRINPQQGERGALDKNYVPRLWSEINRDLPFNNGAHPRLALMHMQYICFQNARLIRNVCTSVSISIFVMDDQQYNS